MKRKLQIISLFFVIFSLQLKAQCPISTAVDFTATDIHGQEITLFDILDGGQYVLIDFFYTTCGPCNQVAPHVKEAYERLGCNQYEVFFMEISPTDNDAALNTWINKYGIEYPTIGTSGGGATICSQYGIQAYPTLILIAPDRNIVIQDIWPISSSNTIVNALAPFGIEEHDCGGVVDCEPATNVQAEVHGYDSSVHLTWDAPANRRDVILNESFDLGDLPEGWTTIDADGDGYNWVWYAGGKNFGEQKAEGGTRAQCMMSESSINTGSSYLDLTPDNYLITPLVEGATKVTYNVGSPANSAWCHEYYAVCASSTGTDVADFQIVMEEHVVYSAGMASIAKEVELPEGTKYVAFRHFNCEGQLAMLIDDVIVYSGEPAPPVDEYTYTITRNGTEIASGITETSYIDTNVPDDTYMYCVEVVYANCTSEPSCAAEVSVDNIEIELDNSVKVYPNPASDIINVEGKVSNITMYNSFGQAVKASLNNGQIDVTSLTNGVYHLVIKDSDMSRKVVKVIIAK